MVDNRILLAGNGCAKCARLEQMSAWDNDIKDSLSGAKIALPFSGAFFTAVLSFSVCVSLA